MVSDRQIARGCSERLLPLLEHGVEECAWWDRNDPCFLKGNATYHEKQLAARIGCGNL